MGCDIHLFVEKKDKNGVWVYEPNLKFNDRAYDLFAKLAGVRNYYDIKPISAPRGHPKDMSDSVKKYFEKWSSDIHSKSYLYISELFESLDHYDVWDEFVNKLFELSKNENRNDVRIVFGFDN